MSSSLLDRCDDSSLIKRSRIESFKKKHPALYHHISSLVEEKREILSLMIGLGQGHVLLGYDDEQRLSKLAQIFLKMDKFYASLGGIVGYQGFIKKLTEGEGVSKVYDIEPPKPIDIRKPSKKIDRYVLEGIKRQRELCEIIPCGGAADRLDLKKQGEKYPAACFVFNEITLLERIIRDLKAREYLYETYFGEVIETPIVLMVSHAARNKEMIEELCEQNKWFGRSKESFQIIVQPSVPMFDQSGKWAVDEDTQLIMRPGGHGVLWHLMDECGVFSKLLASGIKKGVVRQINNPAAGLDHGICALIGIGCSENKAFGFTSCPRVVGMNEGVNVVKRFKDQKDQVKRVISNIEYCDFAALEKIDCPTMFPANTNTLFVDLRFVQKAQRKHPFPGLLLNFKKTCTRLESTMQNIADPIQLSNENAAFLTFNKRSKSLAAIKRQCGPNGDDKETDKRALLNLAEESKNLLEACGMSVPDNLFFSYHPALGPLYSIISQKIMGGRCNNHAKICLEIAEIYLRHLQLDGELKIQSPYVTKDCAKCYLDNVTMRGKVTFNLGKRSLLIAENLAIEGDITIDVPDDTSLLLLRSHSGLERHFAPLDECYDALYDAYIENDCPKLKLKIPLPTSV